MELSDIIVQKIKDTGPVSFRDFMDICLYYPELGYYTSANNKIGATGDYYTSACLTPAFGATIGRQLEEMWRILGSKSFTIVEYGAGTGFLCHDILDYLKNNEELYDKLHYCIIEKSAAMREKEKAHLHEKVSWYDSIKDIPINIDCILSNELVDNFPVHQVVMKDELMEVFVDYDNGFTELLVPAKKALSNYLNELSVQLPRGFRTEINLAATEWIKEIAACIKKGFVITIDYGYTSTDMYRPYRSEGTLVCYNKHKAGDEFYKNAGSQDITAHVNFSALMHWGEKNGLACCGCTSQANFLLACGFIDFFMKEMESVQCTPENYKRAAFLKHTLLVNMGSKFKVLIQCKGLNAPPLLGLSLS